MHVNYSYYYQEKLVINCQEFKDITENEAIQKIKDIALKHGIDKLEKINVIKRNYCKICGKLASFRNENDPHWYCKDHK